MSKQAVSKTFLVRIEIKRKKPVWREFSAIDKKDCIWKVRKEYYNVGFRILEIVEK